MPNNLPSELTSFVGRRSELAQIGEPLQRARLLTLTGAGGCGKTRLALQAAVNAMDHHPDGVWWVELARLEDATLVALDNCEHLLTACAQRAEALLRSCALLRILATSRAPLGVPGEITWRVPSMSLPTRPAREPIEVLRQSDAVSLFIDRATQVRPDFVITAANAPAIAQICSDLDGIPLAIELAAARVRMLAPEQIADALSGRFRLLTGGGRTVTPRHQTLEASIEWSHELLSAGERALLRRLSVFTGGWTLEAAEQVCLGAGDDWCRTCALQALAFGWIFQDEFDAARPVLDEAYATAVRLGYWRGFAWHWFCLGWEAMYCGRLDEARELLARSVAASDEVGDPGANSFANALMAYTQLAGGETERAYSLAGETLRRVLATGAGLTAGFAHQVLGRTEIALGEFPAAREHLEAAVEADRLSGNLYPLTWDLAVLGALDRMDGNLEAAHGHTEEALEIARRIGSGLMQAHAERVLGRLALAAGQAIEAERYVHDALSRLVTKGFALDIPECLDILAAIAAARDSFEESARLLGAAAAGRQRLGIVRFPPEPQFWASVELTTQEALGPEGTPTELEVTRHISAGLTNHQIGERMFISPGTVKVHLSHIFAKLGTPSRAHLAAEATKRALDPAPATDAAKH